MTPELLIIKGAISELAPEDRTKVDEIATRLREMLAEDPERALVAFTLVMLERQAEV